MLRHTVQFVFLVVYVSFVTSANANSVGFDAAEYQVVNNQLVVTVGYDFSSLAMFGGAVDLSYDPSVIEFVSFTQAELAPDLFAPNSPVGFLEAPGDYQKFGVGTNKSFMGATSSGAIGTFVFEFVGFSDLPDTSCGNILCLSVNSSFPFVALTGEDISDEILANGISSAGISQVPVPAAGLLFLGGLGLVFGLDRTRSS